MEDVTQTTIAVAEMRGEMRAFRELFGKHTEQDMEQFTDLKNSIKDVTLKIDQLLIREAERVGEVKGLRRTALVISTCAALVVSAAGVAVAAIVGG